MPLVPIPETVRFETSVGPPLSPLPAVPLTRMPVAEPPVGVVIVRVADAFPAMEDDGELRVKPFAAVAGTLTLTAPELMARVVMVTFDGTTIGNVSPALTVLGPTISIVVGTEAVPMIARARVIVWKAHPSSAVPPIETALPFPVASLPLTGSTKYVLFVTEPQDEQVNVLESHVAVSVPRSVAQ
jgi:hypothetical protein